MVQGVAEARRCEHRVAVEHDQGFHTTGQHVGGQAAQGGGVVGRIGLDGIDEGIGRTTATQRFVDLMDQGVNVRRLSRSGVNEGPAMGSLQVGDQRCKPGGHVRRHFISHDRRCQARNNSAEITWAGDEAMICRNSGQRRRRFDRIDPTGALRTHRVAACGEIARKPQVPGCKSSRSLSIASKTSAASSFAITSTG